jgi:hypothetical protein
MYHNSYGEYCKKKDNGYSFVLSMLYLPHLVRLSNQSNLVKRGKMGDSLFEIAPEHEVQFVLSVNDAISIGQVNCN